LSVAIPIKAVLTNAAHLLAPRKFFFSICLIAHEIIIRRVHARIPPPCGMAIAFRKV